MRQAPFRHDRAAARHDPGHPRRGQMDIAEPHAGMDREIIDALLGLFDQRVAEQFPGQLLGLAADLFQSLIDRHRADRHRRVADDPFADRVDVAPGRQVHDRVGAPARRPDQLVDFLGDRRGDDRIADIRVDLHQEVAADDHRLGFRVVDVVRDDRPAARDLVAHEFRRHMVRNAGAERLAVARPLPGLLAAEIFADRDIFHLRGDDAALGIGVLRHRLTGLGAQDLAPGAVEFRHRAGLAAPETVILRSDLAAVDLLDIAARQNPSRGAVRAARCGYRSRWKGRNRDPKCRKRAPAVRWRSGSGRSRASRRADRRGGAPRHGFCATTGTGPVVTCGTAPFAVERGAELGIDKSPLRR